MMIPELEPYLLKSQNGELLTPAEVAKLINLTLLGQEVDELDIEMFCREAGGEHPFGSVTVHPKWVGMCADRLKGSGVGVRSVLSSPLGPKHAIDRMDEAEFCLNAGASGLDLHVMLDSLFEKELSDIEEWIAQISYVFSDQGKEEDLAFTFDPESFDKHSIVRACIILSQCGTRSIKILASQHRLAVEHVQLVVNTIGARAEVHVSGNISDLFNVHGFFSAGVTGLSTPHGVGIVNQTIQALKTVDHVNL